MKKAITLATIATLAIVAYSCKKSSSPNHGAVTQTVKLDLPATTEKFYTTTFSGSTQFVDSKNRVATLGKVLFYDTHLSVNNAISCGPCHKQALGFADNAAFSHGLKDGLRA